MNAKRASGQTRAYIRRLRVLFSGTDPPRLGLRRQQGGRCSAEHAVTPQQAQEMYGRGVGMYMAAQATGDRAKAAQAVALLTKSANAGYSRYQGLPRPRSTPGRRLARAAGLPPDCQKPPAARGSSQFFGIIVTPAPGAQCLNSSV